MTPRGPRPAARAVAAGMLSVAPCCATLRTTGDAQDYPIQVYSGAQYIASQGPGRQDEPRFRQAYLNVYVVALVCNAIADTLVLPIMVPLTVWNVLTPQDWHGNFALEREPMVELGRDRRTNK